MPPSSRPAVRPGKPHPQSLSFFISQALITMLLSKRNSAPGRISVTRTAHMPIPRGRSHAP